MEATKKPRKRRIKKKVELMNKKEEPKQIDQKVLKKFVGKVENGEEIIDKTILPKPKKERFF